MRVIFSIGLLVNNGVDCDDYQVRCEAHQLCLDLSLTVHNYTCWQLIGSSLGMAGRGLMLKQAHHLPEILKWNSFTHACTWIPPITPKSVNAWNAKWHQDCVRLFTVNCLFHITGLISFWHSSHIKQQSLTKLVLVFLEGGYIFEPNKGEKQRQGGHGLSGPPEKGKRALTRSKKSVG